MRGCCGFNENLFSTNIDVLNQQINSTSDLEVIKNFNVATKLLENFRENKSTPAEIFNLDLMAKGFAISDILGSWHSSHWSGMNFYFDPISKKLEPIFEDNYNENSTYPSKERMIRIDDTYNYSLLYKRLFNSPKNSFSSKKYTCSLDFGRNALLAAHISSKLTKLRKISFNRITSLRIYFLSLIKPYFGIKHLTSFPFD